MRPKLCHFLGDTQTQAQPARWAIRGATELIHRLLVSRSGVVRSTSSYSLYWLYWLGVESCKDCGRVRCLISSLSYISESNSVLVPCLLSIPRALSSRGRSFPALTRVLDLQVSTLRKCGAWELTERFRLCPRKEIELQGRVLRRHTRTVSSCVNRSI